MPRQGGQKEQKLQKNNISEGDSVSAPQVAGEVGASVNCSPCGSSPVFGDADGIHCVQLACLHPLIKEPEKKELNSFRGFRNDGGWVNVRGVMDSGASEGVAPPDMCPTYAVVDSPGFCAGQHYVSASKDKLPNLGQQILSVVLEDGQDSNVKSQIAGISRPLSSVSEICDSGNQVIFGRSGGMVLNLSTGKETHFARENGVYILEFWVKPNSECLQRQGEE